MRKKIVTCITLEPELVEKVDRVRGDINRSVYLSNLIEERFKENCPKCGRPAQESKKPGGSYFIHKQEGKKSVNMRNGRPHLDYPSCWVNKKDMPKA